MTNGLVQNDPDLDLLPRLPALSDCCTQRKTNDPACNDISYFEEQLKAMKINPQYFSKQSLQAFREYCSHNWGLVPLFTSIGVAVVFSTSFMVWTSFRKQDLVIWRREDVPYYERMDPTDIVRSSTNLKPNDPLTSELYKVRLEIGPYTHLPEEREKH